MNQHQLSQITMLHKADKKGKKDSSKTSPKTIKGNSSDAHINLS